MSNPFPHFTSIGEEIYLHKNALHSESPSPPDHHHHHHPSLIILCTWLGASTAPRINKYIQAYLDIYPSSPILLIRGLMVDMTIRTSTQVRKRLSPARKAIANILSNDHRSSSSDGGELLLHIFSHGGCASAIRLCVSEILSSSSSTSRTTTPFLPLRLVVFDSCPGDASFSKAYSAAVLSLPQTPWIVFSCGKLVMYPFVGGITAMQNLGLFKSVRDLREDLNSETVFGNAPRRLYLVSKEDVMVGWRDVVGHAGEAKRRGYHADVVVFEHGRHCSIVVDDGQKEGYWMAVRRAWSEGPRGNEGFVPPKSRL